jgi:hypothetical protein
MRQRNNVSEASAEMLLNYLYPEMDRKWIAHGEGSFYRNYNNDLLDFDDETMEAWVARDTFLNLLPQGVINNDNDLRGEDAAEKFKKIQRRVRLLNEAFLPIDTTAFRQRLYVERQVSELLQNKLSYVLNEYFGINLDEVESPLVKEAALMLPYVSRKRGDFGLVGALLGALLHCKVQIMTGRYSQTDTTLRWLPRVRYELLIPGLSPEEFRTLNTEVQPLRDFICEWFIPFEVKCDILIKEHHSDQQVNTRLTLGYNMELKND